MWKNINLERCLDHINSSREAGVAGPNEARPAITISRMCGSGGRTVASQLAEYLDPHAPYGTHWTVFDHALMIKVLEEHRLSVRLAGLLPERSQSLLRELIDRLRGKGPQASRIVEQTVETIWHLVGMGYVILVGRGANVITAKMPNVFHVRLVGSLENRLERLEEVYDFDRRSALAYLKAQDASKKLYLKEYFGADIEDPQLYHLIVNTDRIAYGEAAKLIGDAAVHWFKTAPVLKSQRA